MTELEEEKQQIAQIKQSIDQRNNDLKAREAKIAEIEPLIPSVKAFLSIGITFDLVIPYITAINEKPALENIDLKTAAYNIVRVPRPWKFT